MSYTVSSEIFKAYDIRGLVPTQITPEVAFLIGKAYAQVIPLQNKTVAVGRDVRTHGRMLQEAVMAGLQSEGIKVVDLGVISTDMLYFAVGKYGYAGGITVSASHNPAEYNGFKLVKEKAIAIAYDTGINLIQERIQNVFKDIIIETYDSSAVEFVDTLVNDYIDYLATFVDIAKMKSSAPLTIGFNANHGITGEIFEKLVSRLELPITTHGLYLNQDGTFPQGRPDPMYDANQKAFAQVITQNNCAIGCAVDADADRAFFFTREGEFVDGYYTTALLAHIILQKNPNAKIIHDPRLTWAVIDEVKYFHGTPIVNRVGHSYIKQRMKEEDAIFGGENSGHYYFRDFYYADSGLLTILFILSEVMTNNLNLSELLSFMKSRYPISGEINTKVANADAVIANIEQAYPGALVEKIDGLSLSFDNWRCNVRKSNTEPLVRLNVEAKTKELVDEKVAELMKFIK